MGAPPRSLRVIGIEAARAEHGAPLTDVVDDAARLVAARLAG